MSYRLYKDGKPWGDERASKLQCLGDILEKGWYEPIEKYGVVWVKGIEIRETQNVLATSTREVSAVS